MSGPVVKGLTSIVSAGNATKVAVDIYGRVTSLSSADLSGSDVTGILAAARFPALTGDLTTIAGALATTLATVNANVGAFALATVTVNAKGLITAASAASTTGSGNVVLASSPTITTPTIAKLANLTTNGFIKTSGGDGTLGIDTSTYITGNQSITLSGDISGSGATTIVTTLATVNSNVGSFTHADITVNAKGLVTAAAATSVLGLARGGTAVDLSTTGSSTAFLAQDASHVISARAIISADIATALTTPGAIGGTTASTGAFTTLTGLVTDSATTTVTTVLTLGHNSSGTPGVAYGTRLEFQGKSNTTNNRSMGGIRTEWVTATDASRASKIVLSVYAIGVETDVLTLASTGLVSASSFTSSSSSTFGNVQIGSGSQITGGSGNGAVINYQNTAANTFAFTSRASSTNTNIFLFNSQPNSAAENLYTFQRTGVNVLNIANIGDATITGIDTVTNTVTNILTVDHDSSGTPAASYGIGLLLLSKSSTTSSQSLARIRSLWTTATHASRKARLVLSAFDTSERDCLMIEASGSAAMIGFLGTAPVIQQTSGANLTNNVTAGGTTDQIDDFAGTLYATDAATIRNDIYQLARKQKQINDGLRTYGLFT